jgi:uncharacterized damage-inducible protein DinB
MNTTLDKHNFSEYFLRYTDLVKVYENVVDALEITQKQTNELLNFITEDKGNYSYDEGKWTIKEILVHIIDAERIFCNRALRFARKDKTDLPGFNHEEYVKNSNANERTLCDICKEMDAVREATITLFKNFTPEMLDSKGSASGNSLTVLTIGYLIAGHEKHHLNVLEEKYL